MSDVEEGVGVEHEVDGEVLDIMKVGEVFSYTIPSFSVISVQLRRIVISNYGRDTTDEEIKAHPNASPTLDIFLREDPRFHSLAVPTTIRIIKGCIVPVSVIFTSFYIMHPFSGWIMFTSFPSLTGRRILL